MWKLDFNDFFILECHILYVPVPNVSIHVNLHIRMFMGFAIILKSTETWLSSLISILEKCFISSSVYNALNY